MREVWDRLGGREAISWATFVVVVVLQFAGSFLASGVDFAGREIEFSLLSLATLIPVIIILVLARVALRARVDGKPLPLITVSFLAVAIVFRAVLFGNGLVELGFTDEARIGYRVLSSSFSMGFGAIVTAYLFSLSQDITRDSRVLSSTISQLTLLSETAQDRIAHKHDGLLRKIRDELEFRLLAISGNARLEDRANLQRIIDDVVRPLSYDLARQVEEFKAERVEAETTKISWRSVVAHAMAVDQTRPAMFSLVVGVETFHFAPMLFGQPGFFGALALTAISFVVLSVLHRAWRFLPSSLPTGERAFIFTGIHVAGAILGVVAVWLLSGIVLFTPAGLIAIVFFIVTLGWTFALASSASAQLRSVVAQLSEASLGLKRELVRLNANYRQLQKGVARVLHGPIQDAVAAAVYKMASPRLEDTASPLLVQDLRARISGTLEGLNSPEFVNNDVVAALSDLAELWRGVVEIDLQLDSMVVASFSEHPVTASTVIELVREVCSNAVRHGDAGTICVQVVLGADVSVIELNIANDGTPVENGALRGIGSQLLEELSLSWSRVQDGTLVRVRATVPVI